MPTINTDELTTQYLENTNTGDGDKGGDGIVVFERAQYDYSTGDVGIAQALTKGSAGIWGSANAWAAVGTTFDVTGSESRDFDITAVGDLKGEIIAGAAAEAEVELTLICNKLNSDVQYDTRLFFDNRERVYWDSYNMDINETTGTLPVTLTPDNNYEVLLRISTSISLTGLGGGTADIGEFDGDPGKATVDFFALD